MSVSPDIAATIQRFQKWEEAIDALLPAEPLRGRVDPVLRAAIERYVDGTWKVARGLPAPEDAEGRRVLAGRLAPYPVFVVGIHRSGTSLLQHLLDGHPALAVLPSEGSYLTNLYPRICRLDEAQRPAFVAREWLSRLINPSNQPPYWTLGRTDDLATPYLGFARTMRYLSDAARSTFDRYAPFQLHLAVAMAWAWASHGEDSSLRHWVDKTPLNELRVDRLRTSFPQARFVHVVRDPHATVASWKQLQVDVLGRPRGVVRFVRRVARSLRLALRHERRLGRDVYRIVRYEDLVDDLPTVMAALAGFLGIAPTETLLRPTVAGRPVASNSSFLRAGEPGHVHDAVVRPRGEILTPLERRLVSVVTGRCGREMGYGWGVRRDVKNVRRKT